MGFCISVKSDKNVTLYLINRNFCKNPKQWWTSNIEEAVIFDKRFIAEKCSQRFIYRNPEVIEI